MTTDKEVFVEVRESAAGWRVFYPDEAYMPCVCSDPCKNATKIGPKLVESYFRGDKEAALLHAAYLVPGRPIKVTPRP
jgi:hypothetical protein